MWVIDTIENLCEIEYGTRVVRKREQGTIYPVYGGGGETFRIDRKNRTSRVVIARFGMSERCTRYVDGDFFLNDSGLTLSPKSDELSQDFLNKIIFSLNDSIYSIGRGTAQKNLNMDAFKKLIISYPPLAEQERIVVKLDAAFAEIDEAIEATTASIEQAQIGLSNLIDDKTSNKSDWKEFKVSELGKVQTGNTPKTSEKINYGNDIPFVKPPHFRTDGTIEVVEDGLSHTGAKLSRKAPPNSVMMVCIGATIGKVAVCHEEVCFNQQINSLSPTKDYDAELIYWQMRGNRFQKDIRERAGQATLPIISKAKWANLSIYLPCNTEAQVQIRNQLRALSDLTEKYCSMRASKIDALNNLKSAILKEELQSSEAA